ncbi:MAG: YutD family protein [Sporolactobacillus sp.]
MKTIVSVERQRYEVIENVRNGWDNEAFLKRYSDVLSKFDYVVGDWGYEQLRLRGFYEDKNQKSTFDTRISTLVDYLMEYCSFGCAYFVLHKLPGAPARSERQG